MHLVWLELVGKNYAVERACAELETEVDNLETEKVEGLKKQKVSEETEIPADASWQFWLIDILENKPVLERATCSHHIGSGI